MILMGPEIRDQSDFFLERKHYIYYSPKLNPPELSAVEEDTSHPLYFPCDLHGKSINFPNSMILPTYPGKIPQTSPFTPTRKEIPSETVGKGFFWYLPGVRG